MLMPFRTLRWIRDKEWISKSRSFVSSEKSEYSARGDAQHACTIESTPDLQPLTNNMATKTITLNRPRPTKVRILVAQVNAEQSDWILEAGLHLPRPGVGGLHEQVVHFIDRAREFAVAETMDGGKPIKESRDFDVPMAAAHFFYHAGWADKLDYAFPGAHAKPLGVVGQVIPWNFPLLMLAWKIAPALATGNCVVLKPAETTSVTAFKFAELLQEADLPPGVVNFVSGAGETGALVMGHPIAAKVAFTGSTEVGKRIMRQVAGTDKKMTMELGGKAANIVFDDSPVDQAVEGVVKESSSIRVTSAARDRGYSFRKVCTTCS